MPDYTYLRRFDHCLAETTAAYHEAALLLGLSDSALDVLYTLCLEGRSCPIGSIIGQSCLSKQTLNSALRRLEADGLIRLEADSGRRKRVSLTEQGDAYCRSTVMRLIDMERRIFEGWTEEERRMHLELTQRYVSEFKAEIGGLI